MSRLSLSDGEFKIGYTRYLLIKEICPTEIALSILLLEIRHRRKTAYACFFSLDLTGINENKKAVLLLESLEDRFLNPVVIAMLADLNSNSDRIHFDEMRKARDLLYLRKEEDLSDIELYFKARTLEFTFSGHMRDHAEIRRIYEIGVSNIFIPSYSRLARHLRRVIPTAETD